VRRFYVVCWGDPTDSTWDIVDVTGVTDEEWQAAARPDDDDGDRPWVDAVLLAPVMVVTRPNSAEASGDGSWNLLTFAQFAIKAERQLCSNSMRVDGRHDYVTTGGYVYDYDASAPHICRYCKLSPEEVRKDREDRLAAAEKITRELIP